MAHQAATKAHTQARVLRKLWWLGLVAILALVALWLLRPATPATNDTGVQVIETQFDQGALDEVLDKSSDYPQIDDSDVGKEDPFSQ